jgi:DNA primase
MEGRPTAVKDFIQRVKESTNIIDIVGENVVLRKSGTSYVGLCPFHSERSPSFSVNELKQLYHCYGCKRGGDLITFVMEISGLSFHEAIEELAIRANQALPSDWNRGAKTPEALDQKKEQTEKLALAYKLNRFVAAFFHQTLKNDPQALGYLSRRGVNSEVQQAFYLGSAPGVWDALSRYLVEKKAPMELAHTLGLTRPSPQGGFDLFRHRVIFPILNMRGKVAGFGGRILNDQDQPKYLNSPDSLVFNKGKLAFGLYQAQKYIREQDEVILVEGYFDALTLFASGFRNVVATCGTALTVDHLQAFKRLASRVTVLFDGDSAGVAATVRAMEIGLDQGWILQGAQLPRGLDPDELLLNPETGQVRLEGREQLAALLRGARPILDSQIEDAVRSAVQSGRRDPEAQTQALKKIGRWLSRFNDPIGREVRLELLEKQLGVSRAIVLGALGRVSSVSQQASPSAQGAEVRLPAVLSTGVSAKKRPSVGLLTQMDRILLSGLAREGEYLKIFFEAKSELPESVSVLDLLTYLPAKKWVALKFQGQFPDLNQWSELSQESQNEDVQVSAGFPELLQDESLRSVITAALVLDSAPVGVEEFKTAVFKSVAKKWARFSQQIKRLIVQAEARNDAGLHEKLMKDYLDVQRKMKDFNSFYDEE